MDTLEKATTIIRDVLHSHDIEVEQIFLFGSRAKGTHHAESDWDFYVLVKEDLPFPQRRQLTTEIRRILARLRIPNDVILKYSKKYHETKMFSGHLAYSVAQEGVPV